MLISPSELHFICQLPWEICILIMLHSSNDKEMIRDIRSLARCQSFCHLVQCQSDLFSFNPCGVPQGSVFGPILLTMYTTPLGNIIRKHGLNFHLYADDTQLYISFHSGVSVSKETAISCLETCIKDIKIWMTNNILKLNDDKTELIVITTHSNTSQNQHIGIHIGDSLITPNSELPRNLGVLFDSTCSLNDNVSNICKSINYNLYSIGKIRKYLDTTTAKKMINCSITSRLDYCNSLLYGAKGYNISQLQLCQNNAARMLSLRRNFDHITPVLKDTGCLLSK